MDKFLDALKWLYKKSTMYTFIIVSFAIIVIGLVGFKSPGSKYVINTVVIAAVVSLIRDIVASKDVSSNQDGNFDMIAVGNKGRSIPKQESLPLEEIIVWETTEDNVFILTTDYGNRYCDDNGVIYPNQEDYADVKPLRGKSSITLNEIHKRKFQGKVKDVLGLKQKPDGVVIEKGSLVGGSLGEQIVEAEVIESTKEKKEEEEVIVVETPIENKPSLSSIIGTGLPIEEPSKEEPSLSSIIRTDQPTEDPSLSSIIRTNLPAEESKEEEPSMEIIEEEELVITWGEQNNTL